MKELKKNVVPRLFTFTGTDKATRRRLLVTIEAESAEAARLALSSFYADLEPAEQAAPNAPGRQ